jgi:HEAT repeat protein
MELLARALNTSWTEELKGELFTFIALQHSERIEDLFRFLGQIEPEEPRRVVTDALLLLSDCASEEFAPLTDDGNTRLACDALYALGRIGDALTLSRICGTFERPEPGVRAAVLTTLRDFQSPRVHRLMRSALSDPAAQVRTAALRYITVYKIRDAMKPIAKRIRSRSFASYSFEERRGWFIAFGYLAGTDALPALQKRSEPSRGGSQINEDIHLALLGIKATRCPEANAWLKEFADSSGGDLQLLTHKILSGRKGGRS